MTDDYRHWNTRLLDYCCEHSVDDQGNVFLTIDSFLEAQDESDSEDRFKQAVRDAFRPPYAHKYEERIRSFCQEDSQRKPLCAALLGVSVLAAADMDNNAYYEHLSSWLACSEYNVTKAFMNSRVLEAWGILRDYFKRYGLVLPLPPSNVGKPYVKFPQQHALLRQIDLRRLAHFFYEYTLSPRYLYSDSALHHHFSSWMRKEPEPLTRWGMNAWRDSTRHNSVFKQVRDALENWDEQSYRSWRNMREQERQRGFKEHITNASAFSAIDLRRFDRIQTLPVRLFWEHGDNDEAYLYFQISRVQANLPLTLSFCDGAFERRRDGDYSVIPIDSTKRANILLIGCEERIARSRICFQIDPENSSKPVFIFQNIDGDGYAQVSSLKLGLPSAILVRKQYEGRIAEWLSLLCSQVPKRLKLAPCLAQDWVLLTGFTLRRADVSAPIGFSSLHVSTELNIQLYGGLRLDGNRNVWMESAPPKACFVGRPLPDSAMVNDKRIIISKEGLLASDAIPSAVGEYRLTAVADTSRPVQRFISVKAACLYETRDDTMLAALFGNLEEPFEECFEELLESAPTPKIALPEAGSAVTSDDEVYQWCVLGASPGQICMFASAMSRRAMSHKRVVGFVPVWAIGRNHQGIIVEALNGMPPLPCCQVPSPARATSSNAERLWLKTIQAIHPRGLSDQHQVIWQKYQAIAVSRNVSKSHPAGRVR